jgi:uncharacterized protein YkwD
VGTPPQRPADTTRSLRQHIAGAALVLCTVAAFAGTAALAPRPAVAQTVAACPNATDTVDTVGLGAVRDAVGCAVNAIRSEHRLAQFVPSATLAVAAQRHGADMVTRRYFAHVSPSGGTIEKRARRAGYMRGPCWVVGENLGMAVPASASAQAVVDAWMDSPSHRAIIMDPEFRHMGLAVVPGAPGDDGAGSTFVLDVGSNDCAFPAGAAQVRARPRVRAG